MAYQIDNAIIKKDADGKPMVGKLVENIRVLAVKDKNGRHVFENSEEERTPATIIFAVPENIHILLRQVVSLSNVKITSSLSFIDIFTFLLYIWGIY